MNSSLDPLISRKSMDARYERQSRRSLTSRISTNVARRLSIIGVAEEPRDGTVIGATINTLCNIIGAGVLSLPLALYGASVMGGIVLMVYTILLASVSAFAVIVGCDRTKRFSFTEVMAFLMFPSLSFEEFSANAPIALPDDYIQVEKGAMEMEEMRRQYTESEITRRKRRRIVTIVVELMVFLNNYGSLIIYSRVIADSVPPVVEDFLHGSGFVITRTFWLLVSGIVFFLLTCARNMDELKWTSLLGFLTIFYVILAIVARFFTSRGDPPFPNVDPKAHGETNWYHVGTGIFRTMSTYGVAFGYHYNIPYFYKELKDRRPGNMMKTVYMAYPVIFACYIAAGLFGYLTFGNLVADHAVGGDIVRNYPEDDPVVNIGRLGLFLHFACVYPILSVCARRGLHRLLMNALTWSVQTAIIEEERNVSQAQDEGRESFLHSVDINTPEVVDKDRDVGSPEDTTRLAIVLEALFLVSTTIVLAALISGIGMVIDFLGTLFGIFLMLTGPGIIAWCAFSQSSLQDNGTDVPRVYRHARLLKSLAVLLILTGICFTTAGLAFLIKDYAT